jgi:competence ComEA-like helix-hairpin-helix protein
MAIEGKEVCVMKWLSAILLCAVALVLVCPSFLYAECKEGQVDINTATEAQLRTVKGVGPKKAQLIIENRPYASVDDLRKIKGVGAKTLEKWRPSLCVGKAGAAPAKAAAREKEEEPKKEKEEKEESKEAE